MTKEQLSATCQKSLEIRNLHKDLRYTKRLKWELEEIFAKNKSDYFWNLYISRTRYPENQNNLLVCWLLGIVPDLDIDKGPNCVYGEYPDIDTDYIPVVRDYLKTIWARQEFGSDYVCNISNYTTFGIKNSLIDMARVHSESREEVQAITKNLDNKDEDGKVLTWDAAMKTCPDLKKYCEDHPLVAEAARKLVNRNRGMGVHAGGLIIANQPLQDLVPLVKRKDNPQASAWVEGLHGQDLGPMGLIKFDLLVISNLLQIARCCDLVKTRYKIDGICNLPGESDWTDVEKWRSDPAAIEMANRADLKCIFQFDSEGMRELVRKGGVDRFEDLVAYSALYRPGPMGEKMHTAYCNRKRGDEKYQIHPVLKPILDTTYGIMAFQEDVMKILHVVGNIPLEDCESVRKAISKKKVEGFIKYKEMFVIKGQKNLSCSEEYIINLWNQIESFAEYGFNKSHAVAYSYISMWLIYLKAHYPQEFYASMLTCETLAEKIREYKMEAKIHGVETNKLDVNKSGINFELQGDSIYFGFSKIKGLGENPAKRIVENQPYESFEDFLYKFGTDASVLKPILGLRCFKERHPVILWKFAECYKDWSKKNLSKQKRNVEAKIKYEETFKKLAPDENTTLEQLEEKYGLHQNPFDSSYWKDKYNQDEEILSDKKIRCNKDDEGAFEAIDVDDIELDEYDEDYNDIIIQKEKIVFYKIGKVKKNWNRWKELRKLWQKRKTSIDRFNKNDFSKIPRLSTFNPDEWEVKEELVELLNNPVLCENEFYGFIWVHPLESSPDYKGGFTFEALKSIDSSGPVEMIIKKVIKNKSKAGNTYWQIIAEDVTGTEARINVWQDDWDWWSSELSVGNLVRARLQPPSGGFNTFLIESNQVGKYRGQKRYKDKSDDPRIILMRHGEKEEEKFLQEDIFLSDEEALEQFSNCIME